MRDPMKALTSKELRAMGETEVNEYWRAQQLARRAAGLPYYERLVDPRNGKIVVSL